MTDASKTFVLGLGAQKAGTTWLAKHLKASPQYDHGFRKEYHVFDSLDLASETWMRRRIARLAGLEVDKVAEGAQADADMLHRLAMVADTELYFDYFAWLLTRDPNVRATGDMTPDYAMLPPPRYRSIRQAFDARGIRTVGVFLMRDPVDRVWSHLRMKAHRNPSAFPGDLEQLLCDQHTDSVYLRRTRYHETLDAISASLPADDVHVGLYESLFVDGHQVAQIEQLVGLDPRPPMFDVVTNAAPTSSPLQESTLRCVAASLADTYRGVAQRRPDLDVATWWPNARFVLG